MATTTASRSLSNTAGGAVSSFDDRAGRRETVVQEVGERVVAHHEDTAVPDRNACIGELLHRHRSQVVEHVDRRVPFIRACGADPPGAERGDVDVDSARIQLPRLEHQRDDCVGPHPADGLRIDRAQMPRVGDDVG